MADVLDLIRRVQQRLPKVPELVVRDAYISAVRDWCGQSRWHRNQLPGALIAGQQSYNLGSDPFLEIVDVPFVQLYYPVGRNDQVQGLRPSDPHQFNPQEPQSQPYTYAYIPEANIAFYPTPKAAYSVLLEIVVQPTRTTTQISDQLVTKHWKAFESGALAHLLMLKEPWMDPVMAAREEANFKSSINNAKADVTRGYQSGTKMARRRPWITG